MNLPRFIRHLASASSLLLATHAALAADKPIHLRGEITSVSAQQIEIRARNGARTTVQLPATHQVLDVSKTTLATVAENSYLGIAAAPAPGGKVRALGLMVFPEGARGLNEGHFPWDMGPKSTMTNATVAKLVKKGDSAELEMRFGEKTQAVLVDNATSIGQFVPGKPELVAVGAKVMVIANQAEGGPVNAQIVLVGRDGFLPPL